MANKMLEALTHSIAETDFSINRANIVRWLRPFAATTPTLYLLFVIPFAILGYIALLALPALSIWLYLKLINALFYTTGFLQWPEVVLFGGLLIVFTVATVKLARLGFSNPAGCTVSENRAPDLFLLIKKLQGHYGKPRISRIVITRDDCVKITHNPVSGFPLKFKNTLEIGMSALLCTSPVELRGMLAREIAKLASQKNPVTGWLLSLHRLWADYFYYLERNGDLYLKPLYFFFRYYSPLYNAISFFAARRAETRADRYTLEVMEDDDAIDAIIQTIIFQNFLWEKYWPQVMSQPKGGKHRVFLPYKKMSRTVQKNVKQSDIIRWVKIEMEKFGDTSTTLPPLHTRLRLLGHLKPVYPPILKETAAEYYLSYRMRDMLISTFDKSWMRQSGIKAL